MRNNSSKSQAQERQISARKRQKETTKAIVTATHRVYVMQVTARRGHSIVGS